MRQVSSKPLTAERKAELEALAALPDDRIDMREMPEVRDRSKARRGILFRPIKQQLTLRLDADLVEWFKDHAGPDSKGYQSRINAVLREYMAAHEGN